MMETQWWMDYSIWPPISFMCLLVGVMIGILIGNIQGKRTIKERVKLACERLENKARDVGVIVYQSTGKFSRGQVFEIVDFSCIKGLWDWLNIRMKHDGWIDDL